MTAPRRPTVERMRDEGFWNPLWDELDRRWTLRGGVCDLGGIDPAFCQPPNPSERYIQSI